MGADFYTHKDLAEMLDVSETTIKNYRRKFPEFLVPMNRGKPIRFKPETSEICIFIRNGFNEGRSVEEVRAGLYEAFPEFGAGGEGPLLSGREVGRMLTKLTVGMEELLNEQRALAERISLLESSPNASGEAAGSAPGIDFAPVLNEIASLKKLFEKAAPAPAASQDQPEPSRVIVVRSENGDETRYPFEKGARAESAREEDPHDKEDPHDDEGIIPNHDIPAAKMLALPLVIRSEEGEFLGVAGRTRGRFSLTDFLELMERQSPDAGPMRAEWTKSGKDWLLNLTWGDTTAMAAHSLTLSEMTTPKGNSVVLLDSLRIDGKDAGGAFLRTFLLRLRNDRLDDKGENASG